MLRRERPDPKPKRLLLSFDRRVAEGTKTIAGVDEAGRGPLAGPVVACAVVLEPGANLPGLDDSKRLSARKREELFDAILCQARAISWASVGERLIDSVNILRASLLAMTWAVESLHLKPDLLLVDGPYRLAVRGQQQAVIGGDGLSMSVAAASVVAKVIRDRMMSALHEIYPQYSFRLNKGYPTKTHIEALRRHGPCPAHRFSFEPVRRSAERV